MAVIDIGSNSGRVIVCLHEAGGHLRILAGSRAPLRLVRDVDAQGAVTTEALERVMEALRDLRAPASHSGPRRA